MYSSSKRKILTSILKDLLKDLQDWLSFLSIYIQKKLVILAHYFEEIKGILVNLLIVKRGRYSKHFLNISFLFLVAGSILGREIIADYYPTVKLNSPTSDYSTIMLASLSLEDLSTTTVISDKPRFDILDYEVERGDTLSSIAEKFGISVDTIKWANSLKTEKLIEDQMLRIPPVTGIVHKVGAGDTVYSLAKKYKSEPQKVVNFPANDFADLDTFALNIGQIVFIPDGVMPSAEPIYKAAPVPRIIAEGGGRFLWPAQGSITQYPVSYHMAVDIANKSAPDIASADLGVVSYAGCVRYGYGCHVIVTHGDGLQTLYAHLSKYYVDSGAKVSRGQAIGKMGATGRATGIHLHFEVRKNGSLVNPMPFLK